MLVSVMGKQRDTAPTPAQEGPQTGREKEAAARPPARPVQQAARPPAAAASGPALPPLASGLSHSSSDGKPGRPLSHPVRVPTLRMQK